MTRYNGLRLEFGRGSEAGSYFIEMMSRIPVSFQVASEVFSETTHRSRGSDAGIGGCGILQCCAVSEDRRCRSRWLQLRCKSQKRLTRFN